MAALNNGGGPADAFLAGKMAALGQLLTPEELDEFRLRNSAGAGALRGIFGGIAPEFEFTPEEFKVLLDASEDATTKAGFGGLTNAASATAVVRQFLGDEAAEAFARGCRPAAPVARSGGRITPP